MRWGLLLCLSFILAGCGLEARLGHRNGPWPLDPNAPPQTATTIGGQTPEPGRAVPTPTFVRVAGRMTQRPTLQQPEPDEIVKTYLVTGEVTVTATPELPAALDFSTASRVEFVSPTPTACAFTYQRLLMNDVRRVTFGFGGRDSAGCRDFTSAVHSGGLSMRLYNVKMHNNAGTIESVSLELTL